VYTKEVLQNQFVFAITRLKHKFSIPYTQERVMLILKNKAPKIWFEQKQSIEIISFYNSCCLKQQSSLPQDKKSIILRRMCKTNKTEKVDLIKSLCTVWFFRP
jgi:hypothetical protein